jgi:8-oxo-dGTP pyrophosphatase MutT (NUDIX family)
MNKEKAFGIALCKYTQDKIEVLLCKSVKSKEKYGFLKGVQVTNESNEQTAIREFYEESGIRLFSYQLEEFFLQKNATKDIGVYLVNYDKINNIEKYFYNNKLKQQYICHENSDVRFFDLLNLPPIKSKQIRIIKEIKAYVNKKT